MYRCAYLTESARTVLLFALVTSACSLSACAATAQAQPARPAPKTAVDQLIEEMNKLRIKPAKGWTEEKQVKYFQLPARKPTNAEVQRSARETDADYQSRQDQFSKDCEKFLNAYLDFIAAPKAVKPGDSAAVALEDASRRQLDLKIMQYLALRQPFLHTCLIAVIMEEAPSYFHRFSPYIDTLTIPSGDLPGVPARTAYSAPAGNAGAAAASKIDPNGPGNNALVLQNADVALIAVMIDSLKKLEKEVHGEDLYPFLRSDVTTDIRVYRLVLAVLTDPTVSPNPNLMLTFLNSNRYASSPYARYFFIQKIIPDTGNVVRPQIDALMMELHDPSTLAPQLATQALTGLKSITSLDGLDQANDYGFVNELATLIVIKQDALANSDLSVLGASTAGLLGSPRGQGAVLAASALFSVNSRPLSASFQSDCNATLASLVAIAKSKKDKTYPVPIASGLSDAVKVATSCVIGVQSEDATRRANCINFIGTCGPVIAAYPDKFPTFQNIVVPLLQAFQDRKLLGAATDSRINVATALAALGKNALTVTYVPFTDSELGKADQSIQAEMGTTAYEILQTALFNCTPDEQTAFLSALATITAK